MLNKHLSKATQCVGLVRKLPRIKNQVTLKGRRDNAKTKVIIDADPGIDDSLALLMALNSPELDVIGISIRG